MENIISPIHFKTWKSMLDINIKDAFSTLEEMPLDPHSFTFYTSVSVMASSKIEGEQMEVDSYVKHKILGVEYMPELTEKPNDLFNAYLFAKENKLNLENFTEAHKLLTAHLLPSTQRGIIRKTEMLVMEHNTGRIQYEAASLNVVQMEYKRLWTEVAQLLEQALSEDEVFYYAAYIHLAFVNIHPFSDGNGRMARLFEKWFLSEKLGERAWYIQSEKYYYNNVNAYYKNLARMGLFYEGIDYGKSIPFLLMLPQSLVKTIS